MKQGKCGGIGQYDKMTDHPNQTADLFMDDHNTYHYHLFLQAFNFQRQAGKEQGKPRQKPVK